MYLQGNQTQSYLLLSSRTQLSEYLHGSGTELYRVSNLQAQHFLYDKMVIYKINF